MSHQIPDDSGTPQDDGASPSPAPRDAATSRRELLRWGGIAALAAAAGPLLPGTAFAAAGPVTAGSAGSAAAAGVESSGVTRATARAAATAASTFSPLRPPATPLIVRSPYLSTWQGSDTLAGTWSSFWNGHITAFCGIAVIDAAPYLFAGAPGLPNGPSLTTMDQVSLELTATRSIYTLNGGGVNLTVTFFSPVDVTGLKRQSVPFSYVTMQASSSDGASHTVDLHLDISGEWAHGDTSQDITWAQQQTDRTVALTNTPANPSVLAEFGDQASWGTVVIASPNVSGLTWQIGQDILVRAVSASQGSLDNTVDANQPRPINDDWPVFAFNRALGTVTSAAPSAAFQVVVGHVRTPAVSYLGTDLNPWWTTYWGTSWQDMVDWFVADYPHALARGTALDRKIQTEASAAAGGGTPGADYAGLCALALRQAVGGTELVDYNGAPWAFLKEISSDGNVSTLDVTYPAFPAYLYLDPGYLRLLLEPMLAYAETGGWIQPFAEHDLGAHYPNASGGVVNGVDTQEDMPVEESSNILIMTAAVLQRLPAAEAKAFATAHYTILRQWGEYLVANALDPGYQNQTDDFTGFIAHSVNLALKGIIGIGAMGVIAGFAGDAADEASFKSTSFSYISQWVSKGEDPTNPSLDLAYGDTGTWSLKYNAFSDTLLGLDLVPVGIQAQEAAWYQANAGAYGVLLDPRNDYTKADWELWTAAWLGSAQSAARNTLIEGVYDFVNTTPQRVPFSDWYVVASGNQQGFQGRPVVGGMYGLALTPARSSVVWNRIENRTSRLALAVTDQSLADSANVTQGAHSGAADLLWTVLPNGDGTVRIANRNSGKVLAVNDQSLTDGAPVQQYQDNGTPDHNWRIVDAGGGWSKIVNVHSGLVLAVTADSRTAGAQITQWADNGSPDHLWRLIREH